MPLLTLSTLLAATRRALDTGALAPIATDVEVVEDAGLRFQLRTVAALRHKPRALPPGAAAPGRNPFLPPYEDGLYVADVSATHVCLLNKFPVFAHHALLVTRAFEPQEAPLTVADLDALLRGLAGVDALGFYNGGRGGGASQPHKHLQLVPLPLEEGGVGTPVDAAVARGELPFPCAVAPLPGDAAAAHAVWHGLLARVGRAAPGAAYNLLATRAWLMAVPRTREDFEGLSVNALGFAGSLFAKDAAGLARLKAAGPAAVLRHVAG